MSILVCPLELKMCFSLEYSILSAIIMYAVSAWILFTTKESDYKLASIVILGAATMQLAEIVIHSDNQCGTINEIGSKLGFLSLLMIQPVFSFLAMNLYGVFNLPETTPIISILISLIAAALIGLLFMNVFVVSLVGFSILIFLALRKARLDVLWMIVMLLYMLNTAVIGMDTETYFSQTLNRTVSQWCTVDKICEDILCGLDWKWNALNHTDLGYLLYWSLVFFIPALRLKKWAFWAPVTIFVFPFLRAIGGTQISSASASCVWGPLAALAVVILNIPGWLQCQTGKRCRFEIKKPKRENRYQYNTL